VLVDASQNSDPLIRPIRKAGIIQPTARNGWKSPDQSGGRSHGMNATEKLDNTLRAAMTMKKKRAVIYARYSSEMQNVSSIDGQFRLCRKLAEQAGLNIIDSFKDAAKSGQTEAGRDGYAAMLAGVRKHAFDVVIVEDLDRISRNPADIARFKQILAFNKVEIFDQRNGYISDTNVAVQSLMNSIDKGVRANKVRRGHDHCVASGKIPGSIAYGYRAVPGKPGQHEINPDEAKIVVRIFTQYSEGRSPRSIANDLTREGIPTPRSSREKRYCGMTTWNSQAFVGGRYAKGMLGNRKYIGEIDWNTHSTSENPDTRKKVKRPNPERDHLNVSAPQLRIISDQLWNAAQTVRKNRAVKRFGPTGKVTRRPVLARNQHLLSGLLRCGECNGHMRIANTSRSGSARVACAAAHQHGTCSHRRSYDLDELKNGILDGMVSHLLCDEALDAALDAYRSEKKAGARNDSERAAVERKLNALNLQIERLADAIANSDRPVKELYIKIDEKEAERAGLQERLHQLGSPDNVVLFAPKFKDVYRASVLRVHGVLTDNPDAPENRSAFRNLIDAVVVHPTAKRMPYEFTPYARIAALQGLNLFPVRRTRKEVLAAQGLPCSDSAKPEKSVSS
jgi:site-specific DNA recombinase